VFVRSNYALWSIRMKIDLKSLSCDVWSAFKNGYKALTTPPVDLDEKKLSYYDSKDMSTLQCGLEEP